MTAATVTTQILHVVRFEGCVYPIHFTSEDHANAYLDLCLQVSTAYAKFCEAQLAYEQASADCEAFRTKYQFKL